MFNVEHVPSLNQYVVADAARNSLHSNGTIYGMVFEYFPSRQTAQEVLDKFYPKPEHVWEHGDVFKSGHPTNSGRMMYIHQDEGHRKRQPQVIYIDHDICAYSPLNRYLDGAKFLFNIKEKI